MDISLLSESIRKKELRSSLNTLGMNSTMIPVPLLPSAQPPELHEENEFDYSSAYCHDSAGGDDPADSPPPSYAESRPARGSL